MKSAKKKKPISAEAIARIANQGKTLPSAGARRNSLSERPSAKVNNPEPLIRSKAQDSDID